MDGHGLCREMSAMRRMVDTLFASDVLMAFELMGMEKRKKEHWQKDCQ